MTSILPATGGPNPGSAAPTMNAPLPRDPPRAHGGGDIDEGGRHEDTILGNTGPTVSALGLGAMGMSGAYGATDRAESIATVHAALDAGVTLIDTGDFYAMGHNELLIAEALRGRDRDSYTLSVKFGALRGPGNESGGHDNRPEAVRNFLAYSLTRLGTDHIDIYRPARLDPAVPIEETVGAIKDMIDAGYVRHVGLSEVDAATIRRAHAVHPIADLQIEYSLISRAVEADVLPTLRELGIGMTAYGVLGRGLISGHWSAGRAGGPGDFRGVSPRFSERQRRAQPGPGGGAAPGRRGEGVHGRAAGDRLGGRAGRRRHRAAGRCPYPRAAGRGAARGGAGPHRGRPRRDREGGSGRRGAGRPLPAGVHGRPRRGQLKP